MSDSNKNDDLKRGLKPRHVNMIALGGTIGTGLFVALGGSVNQAGPGGAVIAYGCISVMVWFLMTGLGEMSIFMPVSGSFETYATKFVGTATGFALGWNYWYNYAITVAAELAAAAVVIKYWLPDSNSLLWSMMFLALLFLLNYFSVKSYGESEFWFASIKVATIIIFIVVGVLMIVGIIGGNSPGVSNWTVGKAPFPGGAAGVLAIFMIAGFSFQGTEIIGVTAGEVENPEVNIKRATHSVFFRILLFYIGAIIVVSFLIPYNDPNLLKSGVENIAVSPFTLVFQRAGIAVAASVMNAVILTSVLSCGNSGMYVSTRMLYSLAKEGKAPKAFAKVNKRGVPFNALILTTAIGGVSFITSLVGSGTAYLWLVNASSMAGFITWLGIGVCHYRFRRSYVAQGRNLNDLKYRAKLYPLGPILAVVMCLTIIIGQFFVNKDFSVMGFLVSYIGAIGFVVLLVGYKIIHKTKLVKYEEADLTQGFASVNK